MGGLAGGLDKLRGIHGTFYRLLGPEVRGLDGFYGEDIPAYADLGIRIPAEPDLLCDQVYEKTGVQSYIVDANGLGVELMGKSSGITGAGDLAHGGDPRQSGGTRGTDDPVYPGAPAEGCRLILPPVWSKKRTVQKGRSVFYSC